MRILIAVLLLSFLSLNGQSRQLRHPIFGWERDGRPGVRFAYSWQQKPSFEAGIHLFLRCSPYPENDMYYRDQPQKKFSPPSWWNVGAGVEIPFGTGHFIAGPKLFTELNIGMLSMAMNATAFIGNGQIDPRITPEIGLALYGFFGVRYGYNWAPLGPTFETIGPHRLTIFIVLVKPRIHEMLTAF
jgi:hypothetical protein